MAAVVSRPAWRMLVLLIARYVGNLINEHYYYYDYYYYYYNKQAISVNVSKFAETGICH